MTLNDSSSLILIVGALAILAFVVHGLWFSGRSLNRKLVNTSKEDQEIQQSSAVGKVRIVLPKSMSVQADGDEVPRIQNFAAVESDSKNNISKNRIIQKTYELNLIANEGRPYTGLDLEELFSSYGFLRGEKDIYCVYEDPETKARIVFRICSLEAPYSFPQDMSSFSTRSLAIYMQLPKKGKCFIYFKAMRIAAERLVEHLGGIIVDNDSKEYSSDALDALEHMLREYDKSGD
ncbi:cell division protein ZipA C-terminal FtsZ-binding domain-containing protein [Succinivibrio sp.]|uniref:cell division protein ZipA C-terminal FtsZ-binding domain-containing protein n=1 Tax=Succinivibrio sp. TaxID=2053619 RepID=UPI0025885A28|nr:cell division protein ZipA C-terminal FtsZ-binding domain-containing protein [Succinivibrio sp.]MDD6206001.1 cell division protein ZipA C-terminal FtsZ-binding domain-containing protein [Succinivibrio sp.]